jgi:hypothetical protein
MLLVIEKSGSIKEVNQHNILEADLYKKAGFKNAEGFVCQNEWTIDNGENEASYTIAVYGKTTGRAGQENKYEFPPPIDNTLFFGNVVLVNKKGNQIVSLSAKEWETIYDYLYGGFEELGEEDSEEEEEEDDIDETQLTKSGYLKDEFVVNDEEDEEEDEEEEEEEDNDDEEVVVVSKKKKIVTRQPTIASKKKKSVVVAKPAIVETYLDCTSELSEEEYMT